MKQPLVLLVSFTILSLRYVTGFRASDYPTPLESLGFSADIEASRARAASSDARTVTAEVNTRLNAEMASGLADAAEASADKTGRIGVSVRGALTQSLSAQAGAAAAAAATKAAYVSGTAMVSNVEASSAAGVGSQIKDSIAGVLKGLQEWKLNVLYNPMKNGRSAGMMAALPYDKALTVTEGRVAAYQQRAEYLASTANGLWSGASGLANGAVGKQALGQVYQAQADMMKAHEMMSQATQLESQGLEVQRQAQVLAVNIPAYMAASAQKAQQANVAFNPQFAPPPMAIGASAILPPTNILGPPRNAFAGFPDIPR